MGRPEKTLDPSRSPVAAFAYDLRKLRAAAGGPSYRKMSRTALFSPSVLSSAASGYRLPSLEVTRAYVEACGADLEGWEARWHKLAVHTGQGSVSSRRRPTTESVNGSTPSRFAREPVLPWRMKPAQLPAGPRAFVGRVAEIAEARSLMSPPQCQGANTLIIGGQVGVGKTAFALHLARELAAQFHDAQLYADMGAGGPFEITPEEVVTGFLHALGVPSNRMPGDHEQRTALFRSVLAQRSVLVLVDNARSERQVRPLLAPTARSRVLVTSCCRLRGLDGICRLELDVMPREDSLALIGAWVGDGRVEGERKAADSIADACGDLPLALSIVGKAAKPQWPLASIADRLSDPDSLLDRLQVGDVSLRDRYASAYESLPPLAREMLQVLGGRSGCSATPVQLARGMETTPDAVRNMLELLLDTGLVVHATMPDGYRLIDLVGTFAGQQHGGPRVVTLPDTAAPGISSQTPS